MEIPSSSPNIRPISLALIKNSKGQCLYHQGRDKHTNENFYRPLGGGIDFGEIAEMTLKREMLEELNEEIVVNGFITTLENIFTYEGKFGHEICMIFKAEFKDRKIYEKDELTIHEHDGRTARAVWKTLEEIKQEKAHLYPIGLEDLISSL
jgi:NADH pyrophosphatase NudC (nudix superfamily)